MRKLWLGILATLLVVVFVAPSFAWEFSMTGEFEYRLNYLSRIGDADLFGNATMQENTQLVDGNANTALNGYLNNFIGFAGPNTYATGFNNNTLGGAQPVLAGQPGSGALSGGSGLTITRGGFSRWGCDAYIGDQRLTFTPTIKVNNAIRVHGVYTVGGIRNKFVQANRDASADSLYSAGSAPFERYAMHHNHSAAYNTAAIGSWEQVRATIQLPIGTLSIGIKDFPFGTGMMFAQNTATDSALLVVPYGPFRFLFAVWPGLAGKAWGGSNNGGDQFWNTYDNRPDKNSQFDYRYGPLVTYENGPLWLGAGGILGFNHAHKQYNNFATANTDLITALYGWPAGTIAPSYDEWDWLWDAGFKYNNGRFFMNFEAVIRNVDRTINYSPAGVSGAMPAGTAYSVPGNRYFQNLKAFAEGGVLVGPSKFTFMSAWTNGANLPGTAFNNGVFNPTQPGGRLAINYQVLQPYSYLMFPTYAGGNNQFNNDGTGEMSDAYCLAARFDYAAAANLNVFGSYLWAHRVEKNGYYAGSFAGSAGNRTYGLVAISQTPLNGIEASTFKANSGGGFGANANPFVDDGYLGWEAQAGFDWKLLEGLSMQAAYSYWHVGPWFDQAYQVFSPTNLRGDGLMVGRAPIQSLRGTFTITF
jgi:hypothetical protein